MALWWISVVRMRWTDKHTKFSFNTLYHSDYLKHYTFGQALGQNHNNVRWIEQNVSQSSTRQWKNNIFKISLDVFFLKREQFGPYEYSTHRQTFIQCSVFLTHKTSKQLQDTRRYKGIPLIHKLKPLCTAKNQDKYYSTSIIKIRSEIMEEFSQQKTP